MGRLGSKAFLPSTSMVTAPGHVKTLILELRVNTQVFVTLCTEESARTSNKDGTDTEQRRPTTRGEIPPNSQDTSGP